MAWNEPGGGNKDPWGAGARKGASGPPDLDDILRKLQQFLGELFGVKRSGNGNGSSGGNGSAYSRGAIIGGVIFVLWLASGIYIVDPAERGVELRFGRYTVTTLPGPHWHIPYPIEKVEIVNIDQSRNIEIGFRSGGARNPEVGNVAGESLMLTQDENIIDIKLAVQYRIKDARDYLFNVVDPDVTLGQVTESAVREVVGKNKMDLVINEGRTEVQNQVERLIQDVLDRYRAGLQVTSVNMQKAQAPEEVQNAFIDVTRSREDEQRLINEAQTYANGIIPTARGAAARQVQEATAYKSKVVAQAEGEANRFTQVLSEYRKAPAVMRQRLYIEAMELVLSSTGKLMMDAKGGNNVFYLPLGRIAPTAAAQSGSSSEIERMMQHNDQGAAAVVPEAALGQKNDDTRERSRERGNR